MGHYVSWNEVEPHIDAEVAEPEGATVDLDKVTVGISFAETRFDNRLRERYDVPFDSTLHPEAYALAQQITSRWAAAWYLINARQSEAEDPRATWYADRLLAAGDDLLEVFFEGEPPDDTPASGEEYSELPQDGYAALTTAQQGDLGVAFKRGHLPGRTDPW